MAQDFLKSPKELQPQIDPATGRFEGVCGNINLKEMIDENGSLRALKGNQHSEAGSSFIRDSFWESHKLDFRSEEEIQGQIKNLAAGYVPEWNFDISNPDLGSALALVFAKQTYHNVERFNENMEKYHNELVNLLDISPLPAKASQAVVLMEAKEDVVIEKGTQFFAQKEKQTFETAYPAYVTSGKLKSVFMTCGKSGKVLPVMGEFHKKSYIGSEENYFEEGRKNKLPAFSLFQFPKSGLEKQAVVFFHSCIFQVEEETIDCKIEGSPKLIQGIEEGKIKFLYYTKEGFCPIENYRVMGNHILLDKEKGSQPVQIGDQFYSVMVLESNEIPNKNLFIDSIDFSTIGSSKNIEYVGNNRMDYRTDCFPIFGDKLEKGAECYVGLEHYFSKKDSKIYLKFHTYFEEKSYGIPNRKEVKSLKLIKRKVRKAEQIQQNYVCADEIAIEYYNGMGWKRLECDREYSDLFAQGKEADIELSFRCPKDWVEKQTGSYRGRTLRVRLLRAENCEESSSIHKIPMISEMTASYSYEENRVLPEIAKVFAGTSVKDITEELQKGTRIQVFNKGNYEDTSLYLGFDKKLISGPFSLWWQIQGTGKNDKLGFSYSTVQGFKNMKVTDGTGNITENGLMIFDVPQDMDFMELEGENCCWIRITDENEEENKTNIKIQQIVPNGIMVYNLENNGEKGNVEAGAITEIVNKELGIENIRNPLPAFGGCDAESREKMLQRGAYLFSSGNRLVTEKDYEREALYFSDNIDKVSVINGLGKDNIYREKRLYIVPLMKDFKKGKESFYQIQENLKQHLLQHCELSITPEELQIVEPIFVRLNVEVWVDVIKKEDYFEIRNLVQEVLEKFLNPVADTASKGWDIGVIPGKSQIMIRLNSLKNRASIRHIMVNAQYEDRDGIHEMDIEDIKISPYMVVMNGSHHVHISAIEENEK